MQNNDILKDKIQREIGHIFIEKTYWEIIEEISYWTCGLTNKMKEELYGYSKTHVPEILSKETRDFLFSDEVLSFFYRSFREI